MNFEKICYGCFSEKENGVCSKCGLSEDTYQHPILALPFGTILDGRYITGKVLGMGGFGVTYLGFDLRLNIKVAIKEYLPSGVAVRSGDSYTMTAVSKREEADYRSGADRFLEEARMLAQLRDDPNVVSVQNYFKENNTAYFTMDYIEGKSLKELLLENGGRISFEKAKTLLLPVMRSLTAVHGKGLLHRDISPDNIFITDAGQSKLLDFGAARSALSDKSMSVVLKHGFAPQEQYASHGKQGPWTDVYAMGATLYHCITGEMPPDSVDRAFTDALVPPSKLGVKISENTEQAILKSLAVRPEDRFADMASFMDALQNSTVLYEGSGKEGKPGSKSSRNTDGPTAYKNSSEPKLNGFSAFLSRIKTDKKLLAGTVISAVVVLTLAVALPLILSKKPASGAVDNSPSFPLPTIEAPVSAPPEPANYSGTVTLPDIGQFLGTELTTGERDGREVYLFAADSAELLNYVTLLQADDAYSLDSEGTDTKGETFLFKVVQDKAAVQFSVADEAGLLVLSCLDESAAAFTDPPVTQEWLNANGITASRWLEMDEKYGPESENYMGTAVCNIPNNAPMVMQGDTVYFTDQGNGAVYSLGLTEGNKTRLSADNEWACGLNIYGDSLYYYTSIGDDISNIYRLNVKEQGAQPELVRENAAFPAVMGEWLYFVDTSDLALNRLSIDGGKEQMILPYVGVNFSIADDRILYIGKDGSIYTAAPDGNDEQLLIKANADSLKRWGDWITYYENDTHTLMRYSLSQDLSETAADPNAIDRAASFALSGDDIYAVPDGGSGLYRISPDGVSEKICDFASDCFTLLYNTETVIGFTDNDNGSIYLYDPQAGDVYLLNESERAAEARGNSTGNIVNLGRAVSDGENLFEFVSLSKQFANLYKGCLYYVDANDAGRLYRMSLADGNAECIVNATDIAYVNVVDDLIFYRSTDDRYGVHRCELDGSRDVKLSEMRASRLAASEGYLYFANWDSGTEGLWRMDYNGSGLECLYGGDVPLFINVEGEYVYWASNERDSCIARTDLKTGRTEFSQVTNAESLNVYDGRIYFYKNGSESARGIWSVSIDFSDEMMVFPGKNISNINIVNDTIYFRIGGDSPTDGTLNKCTIDGGPVLQ